MFKLIRTILAKFFLWWSIWFDMMAVWLHPTKKMVEDPKKILELVLKSLQEKYPEHYSDIRLIDIGEKSSDRAYSKPKGLFDDYFQSKGL